MFVKNNFIEPRSGNGFTIEVQTDSIVANLAIIDDKGVLVDVELSRANLCTLLHMLELALIETPLNVKESIDASTGC